MVKHAYISDFKSILPRFSAPQRELVEATAEIHEQAAELTGQTIPARKFVTRFGVKDFQVATRHFESDDLYRPKPERKIYGLTPELPQGIPINARMAFFTERAKEIFSELYGAEGPSSLIHVSCTGYSAPSAPQLVAAERGWNTEITHAYHMGCYASLPAIRIAAAQAIAYEKPVDVVHTEMCTLHMDPLANSPEQIVVQTLFADGHIRYLLSASLPRRPALRVLHIMESLIPGTAASMSWVPAPFGMKMELSRNVPEKIKENIRGVFMELVKKSGLSLNKVLAEAAFAIHPGGPQIVEVIKEALELSEEQVAASRKVLLERGNMSSATLPHVWQELLESGLEPGHPVISFAFGPGLTVFASLFEAVT